MVNWFGKKQDSSSPFIVGATRGHRDAEGPLDPALADYSQLNDAPAVSNSQSNAGASVPEKSAQAFGHPTQPAVTKAVGDQQAEEAERARAPLYPSLNNATGESSRRQSREVAPSIYPSLSDNKGQSFHGRPQTPFPPAPSLSRSNSDPGLLEEEGSVLYTDVAGAWPPPPDGAHVFAQQGFQFGSAGGHKVPGVEEALVRIPGAMVHLVDGEHSVLLASGDFSIVRLSQGGKGMVALARVGNDMQWPLGWDEPVLKLDRCHYVFSLRIPADIEEMARSSDSDLPSTEGRSISHSGGTEVVSYGVSFLSDTSSDTLAHFESCLTQYCLFNDPTAVSGAATRGAQPAGKVDSASAAEPAVLAKYPSTVASANQLTTTAAAVSASLDSPEALDSFKGREMLVATSEGGVVKKIDEDGLSERNAEFWTTVAPNVDDYRHSVARGIARGSGHIIRGIIQASDKATSTLGMVGDYAKNRMTKTEEDATISPLIIRNVHRVRVLTRQTDKVASGVLKGVIHVTGAISGKLLGSKAGRAAVQMLPGEVVIVSLDAFGRLFDALELAGTNMLSKSSVVTSDVVHHKYGREASELASDTFASAGHAIHTAWTISKLRKAVDPRSMGKPLSKTQMVKGVVKGLSKGTRQSGQA